MQLVWFEKASLVKLPAVAHASLELTQRTIAKNKAFNAHFAKK